MSVEPHQIYHVFNQGNNRQPVFIRSENYAYFLKLYRQFVAGHCHLLSYCLMPNHFHFLIYTNEKSVEIRKIGSLELTALSNGFRELQSSFAKAINKQEGRTGSLFRQKIKIKQVSNKEQNYALTALHYIHQNPLKAGLVNQLKDWEFSSYQNYAGMESDDLIDVKNACRILDIHPDAKGFRRDSLTIAEGGFLSDV